MQPARSVVDLLGGCRAIARELDISPSAVSRWMAPKSRQNLGGRIPQAHWSGLMAMAKKLGAPLTLAQLSGLSGE